MQLRRFIVLVFSFNLALIGYVAHGQTYPSKSIRIVTSEAGGGADLISRLIAQGIAAPLGQQVVVDNRGGSVLIPAQAVAQAAPDGYTLIFYGSPLWLLPFLDKVTLDPIRDFTPVTLAAKSPNILVVHPQLPVKSVKDLIGLAKSRPGALNYSSAGTGSSTHLAAELFKSMAGVDMVRVLYKGTGPAITALIGGEVQVMFPTAPSVLPHIKSGRLKALAGTSALPSPLIPGLPPIAASGVPGYAADQLFGMFAPAKTPDAVISRLNREMVQVLNSSEVKDKLLSAGSEVVGSSPDQLSVTVKAEMTKWSKIIKDAGIRSE